MRIKVCDYLLIIVTEFALGYSRSSYQWVQLATAVIHTLTYGSNVLWLRVLNFVAYEEFVSLLTTFYCIQALSLVKMSIHGSPQLNHQYNKSKISCTLYLRKCVGNTTAVFRLVVHERLVPTFKSGRRMRITARLVRKLEMASLHCGVKSNHASSLLCGLQVENCVA